MLTARRLIGPSICAFMLLAVDARALPLFPSEFLVHDAGSSRAICVADLDGAGAPELVVATHGPVRVLRFDSDGNASSSTYGSVGFAAKIAAADLNADGRQDIVVMSSADSVFVLLNQGGGALGAPMVYEVADFPTGLAVGDLDQDDHVDLVVGYGFSSGSGFGLAVFLGKGDGTFVRSADIPRPEYTICLAIKDIDADGDGDILVGGWNVSILHGRGDATFESPVQIDVGGLTVAAITTADWNGDGQLDVAVARGWPSSRSAVVLLRNGSAFSPPVDYCAGKQPTGITTADMDGDGVLDLAVSSQSNGYDADDGPESCQWTEVGKVVSLFRGRGDGTFEARRDFVTGGSPRDLVAADLTGDGILDFATVDSRTVSLLVGNGDGSFGTRVLVPSLGMTLVETGDLNGDGNLDLVTGQSPAVEGLTVHLGIGDGTFAAGSTLPFQEGIRHLALADIDGGGPDLLVLMDSTLALLHGNGDGGFSLSSEYPAGQIPTDLVVADVNGDGALDALVSSVYPADELLGYVNNGSGGFFPPTSAAIPEMFYSFAVGRLNADPHLDLVLPYFSGSMDPRGIEIRLGNGDGTFAAGTTIAVGSGDSPISASVVDLDADDNNDLVVLNGNKVSIYQGLGDATFGTRTDYPVSTWTEHVIRDFDLDGNLDLALSTSRNTVVVMRGNGDGTFGMREELGVGIHVRSVVCGDFDRDGAPDLAAGTSGVSGFFSGIAVLLNRTIAASAITSDPPPMTGLRLARRGNAIEVHYRIGPAHTAVDLSVFDVRGRLVRVLHRGLQDSGDYFELWNGLDTQGRRVAQSIYFVSLRAGSSVLSAKAVLLRP